jgi:hypothetical protein
MSVTSDDLVVETNHLSDDVHDAITSDLEIMSDTFIPEAVEFGDIVIISATSVDHAVENDPFSGTDNDANMNDL